MRYVPIILLVVLVIGQLSCDKYQLPPAVADAYTQLPEEIDYNLHVKRILSDKCFACHGPDAKKQKADLRLDVAEIAYAKTAESGLKAIEPGSLSKSEVIRRVLSQDPEVMMPTPASHLVLSPYEKAVLVKWIEQGAEYKPHWAFVSPKSHSSPDLHEPWFKNDIDRWVQHTRATVPALTGLHAPQADRETLIRRLSFDIRGIAPSVAEIDAFAQNKAPNAYEKQIDAFLASPHYGERMSVYWLDLARFADSNGYLDDKHVDMSPWRDWVVGALNRNLPFDQFVTWQLAGDLLPHATQEQILATGFNRNHKQNTEAGIIEEEFRVEYVVDRTNTLGTAFMGLTLGCAKCHDHKYDPISQKDYYSLYAFFNSTFEKGSSNYGGTDMVAGPTLLLTTPAQDKSIADLKNLITKLEQLPTPPVKTSTANSLAQKIVAKVDFDQITKTKDQKEAFVNATGTQLDAVFSAVEFGKGIRGKSLKYNEETQVTFPPYQLGYFERYEPFGLSLWLKIPTKYPVAAVFHATDPHRYGYLGYDLMLKNNHLNFRLNHAYPHDAISVMSAAPLLPNRWYHVAISYDGSSKAAGVSVYLNGAKIKTQVEIDRLVKNIRSYPNIHKVDKYRGLVFGKRSIDRSMPNGEIDEFHLFDDVLSPAEVQHLYQLQPFDLKQKKAQRLPTALLETRKALCTLYDSTKEVMVMGDLPQPRPTYVLNRGLYDSHGPQVQPATPAAILPFSDQYPKNRLGLSIWLFDAKNPLTARVAVNRIWQLIFGKGLVKTSDDFGNQGETPTQQPLLDHLAVWYRQHHWDTKALIKYILMSATYQQSSVASPQILALDPNNEYLTRNPRYRLPAEMIRDNALSVAGLLSSKIGGASTYPYQPEGLWDELSDKSWRYQYTVADGEDLYRKSIYTVRKRTSVVPFLQIFDAPDRSVCTVRRQVSSSPMQSLAMLNDPQIIEAARFVGLRMLREGGVSTAQQLTYGFRLITGRRPNAREHALLLKMYVAEYQSFKLHPQKAEVLLGVGKKRADFSEPTTLAAMTNTALALMNTDEFLTRK